MVSFVPVLCPFLGTKFDLCFDLDIIFTYIFIYLLLIILNLILLYNMLLLLNNSFSVSYLDVTGNTIMEVLFNSILFKRPHQ